MFPYIKKIIVNDCYANQNLKIPQHEIEVKKHIILTGKNGSGKTTILNGIDSLIQSAQKGNDPVQNLQNLKQTISSHPNHPERKKWEENLNKASAIELIFLNNAPLGNKYKYLTENKNNYLFSFFKAHRKAQLGVVNTVTQETDFLNQLNQSPTSEHFIQRFKQYLVNKKVYEAFDHMNSKTDSISQNQVFFEKFTQSLRRIFQDEKLDLEFVQEEFEFYLHLGDGRKITFNQLSEGFSAFISILMDLFMRTDMLRKKNSNYQFNPEGIVLIDEPETHLHIEMQYEILPMLANLFPNIQLIIATHSPAIISSLNDAIVYDLTSKNEVSGSVVGSSFSELMISHFGLENEFSPTVDKLLFDLNEALRSKNYLKLDQIVKDSDSILTPSLRLEVETRIIEFKESLDD